MRKFFLMLLVMTALPGLYAVRVGEEAPKLQIRQWLYHGSMDMAVPEGEQKTSKKLFAVVFWGSWVNRSGEILVLLSQVERDYRSQGLQLALISREPEANVKKALGTAPDFKVGLDDRDRTTTAYMGESRLFPKAFLVAPDGKVIWGGEAVDLPGAVKLYYSDCKAAAGTWQKLAKLREELEIRLRSQLDASLEKVTDQILAIDPEDSFAMRARLFYYESLERGKDAVAFLKNMIKQRPTAVRFYLAAWSLLSRQMPHDSAEVLALAKEYQRNFAGKPDELRQMAMLLMRDFPYLPGSLDVVKQCLPVLEKQANDPAAESIRRAAFLMTTALYYYKIGLPEKAAQLQADAVKLLPQGQTAEAAELVKFFQQAAALQKNK